MKKYYLLLLFVILSAYSFAQVKQQTVTKSSILFHIKNLGITIDGTFAGFKSDIKFDPANLAASSIAASIDVNTIDTDNGTRNDHLKSESFFDAAKYPQITMKSVSFKHRSGKNYTGTFSLTIKDQTKTIDLPFTYEENGTATSFKGSFQLKRSDYGVGSSSLVMSDNVKVDLAVEANK